MKNIKSIFIGLTLTFTASPVFAMVVTDPGSYLYMVEEITVGLDQITSIKEGNATSNQSLTEMKTMNKQLQGSYNKTMGAIENAKSVNEQLKNTATTMSESLSMSKNKSSNNANFKNMEEYLSKVFADPRYAGKKDPALKNLQYNAKQRAFKNTVLISEKIMKGQKDRLKNLDRLAVEIDRTKNVKEATDLTNRMLLEMVRLNIEMLSIQMALTEAYGLQNYTGLKEEDNDKQIKQLSGEKEKKPLSGMQRLHEEAKKVKPMSEWGKL